MCSQSETESGNSGRVKQHMQVNPQKTLGLKRVLCLLLVLLVSAA